MRRKNCAQELFRDEDLQRLAETGLRCDYLRTPMTSVKSLNEESLKNKLVLPTLFSLGFDPAELEFETSFTIQLGRTTHTVDGRAERASGRLDILCTRGRRPLFVIELKAESQPITDADRRQVLSYARLVEPMAPFALLSNGKQTRIYSAVSGAEIKHCRAGALPGLQVNLESELAIRFEALQHFIGLSGDNLVAFCRAQVRMATAAFRAEGGQPLGEQLRRKYIPDTYVHRRTVERQFGDFLRQRAFPIFPVIGPSGVGKTNTMCFLSEVAEGEPFLFYSGTLLSSSMLEQLSMDFNLVFSTQEAPIALLRKISTVAQEHGKNFTVFVDAIDEWESPQKFAELELLAPAFRQLGLRLVVSCKTSNWNDFLFKKGVATAVQSCVQPGVDQLSDFSTAELASALKRYSKFLNLPVRSKSVSGASFNPFALRIMCEVAHSSHASLDLVTDSREIVRRYLVYKLEKSAKPGACWRIVDRLAKLLQDRDQVQIDEEVLRRDLSLPLLEEIPKDLFDHAILYRYVSPSGGSFVGFYFSTVRDYVLACRVNGLQARRGSELRRRIRTLFSSYVGQSAVFFFFRTGSMREQEACVSSGYEFDLARRKHIVADLLAWHGGNFVRGLSAEGRRGLLGHLETTLFLKATGAATADQIIDVVRCLPMDGTIEMKLVDWLGRLGDLPDAPIALVASRISRLLAARRTRSQTGRLISLAMNPAKDGYIRRYAIAALDARHLSRAKARRLFVELIRDPDADVRTWIRVWYPDVENGSVQRELFSRLAEPLPPGVREDIAVALGCSRRADTGPKLFSWIMENGSSDKETLGWAFRALAELRYRPAIPEILGRLRFNINSRLGEQMLICLGEMRARSALPELIEMSSQSSNIDPYWWASAICKASGRNEAFIRKAAQLQNRYGDFVTLLARAMTGVARVEPDVVLFLSNRAKLEPQRSALLSEWGHCVTGIGDGRRPMRLTKAFRQVLYELVAEDTVLSPPSVMLLLELENNVERLSRALMDFLPRLHLSVRGHEVLLTRADRLGRLARILRPWVNQKLASAESSLTLLRTCVVLAELLGDQSTWESVQLNLRRVRRAIKAEAMAILERRLRGGYPPRLSVENVFR